MDETKIREWQQLHARIQKGEPLSVAERTMYDSIVAQWDAEEDAANAENLRQTRASLAAMEVEYNVLRHRHEELNAQITAIEEALEARRAATATAVH